MSKEPKELSLTKSAEIMDFSEIVENIPKKSSVHTLPRSVQEKIIKDILAEKKVPDIVRELQEQGVTSVNASQLHRVKRHVIPAWNYHTEPQLLFTRSTEDTLRKMEYLIDLQYKRIVEATEEELEGRHLLTPSKYIDPESMPYLKNLIEEYYNNTISEVNKNILLSFTERKFRNEFLFKEFQTFWKMLNEYLTFRRDLGDKTIRLHKDDSIEKTIEIYGTEKEKQEIQNRITEKALQFAKKELKDDDENEEN